MLANCPCIDSDTGLGGYRCSYNAGYQGNPYLNQGCQDIDECADHPNNSLCEKMCINTPHGYTDDGRKDGRGCIAPYHHQFGWIKFSAAKVADFGASRLIPLDQTHVATSILGTSGYLDPEYFRTSQLTEESDVYSFGVVLAELLTGLKPIIRSRNDEQNNLADYFIWSVDNNRLFQILDRRVLREGNLEQLQLMAELVKNCLQLHGEDRPTMKEVTIELEGLRKITGVSWSNQHGLGENNQDELSDLYTVPMNSYGNTPNSDSARIMHGRYSPS